MVVINGSVLLRVLALGAAFCLGVTSTLVALTAITIHSENHAQ